MVSIKTASGDVSRFEWLHKPLAVLLYSFSNRKFLPQDLQAAQKLRRFKTFLGKAKADKLIAGSKMMKKDNKE
jgi:hypothetical protein